MRSNPLNCVSFHQYGEHKIPQIILPIDERIAKFYLKRDESKLLALLKVLIIHLKNIATELFTQK
jgi:hypothetical protein